jgi:transglutaminase-like putative cysteine protease
MRVRDLAVVIAGDRQGDEARAQALERYLRNLPYAYEVEPLADGVDGVDHFLFSMRSGYCTYYASAMAVMARALGIPSRLAVGYASGEYDERAGSYLVREADAHAWPELFIAGRWVAFEPTPGSSASGSRRHCTLTSSGCNARRSCTA